VKYAIRNLKAQLPAQEKNARLVTFVTPLQQFLNKISANTTFFLLLCPISKVKKTPIVLCQHEN